VPRVVKAPLGQSAEQIVLRLQKASLQSRVRVEEGFKDFDRHRCGAITIPQFTIGMRTIFGRGRAHQPGRLRDPGALEPQTSTLTLALALTLTLT